MMPYIDKLSLKVLIVALLLVNSVPAFSQKKTDDKLDSTFSILIRSLWIDYAKMKDQYNHPRYRYLSDLGDTTIIYSQEEEKFFYDYKPIGDSLIILVPKVAPIAARHFENKTRLLIERTADYASSPVLTYYLIRSWESWYQNNREAIRSTNWQEEIIKIKENNSY